MENFLDMYRKVLGDFVLNNNISSLKIASQLGKRAFDEKIDLNELLLIHQRLLTVILTNESLVVVKNPDLSFKLELFLLMLLKPYNEVKKLIESSNRQLQLKNDELLRRTEELERSNKELELFAYGVSHDLKEPLAVIAMIIDLLNAHYKDKLDDTARCFLRSALDNATRMQTLINDLLTFARIGYVQLQLKPTDLNKTLQRVLTSLDAIIKKNNVVISVDSLPLVICDETKIERLYQNLISNAIKFVAENITPKIHIGCIQQESKIILYIRDNGIGIPEDKLNNIFLPFERFHSRDKYPGNGLGLMTCKKIIEQHNGIMWVDSEVDHGSTFYFTLSIGAVNTVSSKPEKT